MNQIYYTLQNEWIRFDNNRAFIGLTDKGTEGDVLYIELPDIGKEVSKGEPCAMVESSKMVTEVHSPSSGTVAGINDSVFDDPDIVKKFPLKTWLFYVDYKGSPDISGLLEEHEYNQMN